VLTLARESRELAGSLGWRYGGEILTGVGGEAPGFSISPGSVNSCATPNAKPRELPDLAAAGLVEDPDRFGRFRVSGRALEEAVRMAVLRRRTSKCELDGKHAQRRGRRGAVKIKSGIDWFDEARGHGRLRRRGNAAPRRARSPAQGKNDDRSFPDGSEGILPGEALRALALAGRSRHAPEGDTIRLPKTQGAVLAVLAEGRPTPGSSDGRPRRGAGPSRVVARSLRCRAPRRILRRVAAPDLAAGVLAWLRALEAGGLPGRHPRRRHGSRRDGADPRMGSPIARQEAADRPISSSLRVRSFSTGFEEAARFAPGLRLHDHADR
jgi:hypothetical protein